MSEELDILKKLHHRAFPETELVDIFYRHRDKYRVHLSLVQQPHFPEKHSLAIIPKLYPMDLIRVIKNKRTNPNIRKRAEMEFFNKYNKYPLGEKLSYMKAAPDSLLNYFVEETDKRVLAVMLKNPFATEELILKLINRRAKRFELYETLADTEWYKRPQVAAAIAHDKTAPIKIMIMIIPFLNLKQLDKLYADENTHRIVRDNIILYLQQRNQT